MTPFLKAALLFSTAVTAMWATSAFAEEANSPADERAADGGDIIVTARRVEERLQDVPISMTVFSQEQLAVRNIANTTDLAIYTPSVSTNQRFGPDKASYAIRGFVQEGVTAPTIGVYFADVTAPRVNGATTGGNTAPPGSFMDLQNVQILKGPQGTLQGRNTTGGAILLVPQKPTGELEGYLEGSLGDYNMMRLQGAVNVPLSDTFRVRAAFDRYKRDGYLYNKSGIGPSDYNDVNYLGVRLSLVGDLTPDLENYTIFSYNRSRTNGLGFKIGQCNPALQGANGSPISNPSLILAGITAASACAQIARNSGDGPLTLDFDGRTAHVAIDHWQVLNTTTWRASENLTVKNIISYAEYRERDGYNLTGDNFTIPVGFPGFSTGAPGVATEAQLNAAVTPGTRFQTQLGDDKPGSDFAAASTFTEELQFQGSIGGDRLKWQAGAYYERVRPLGFQEGYSAQNAFCANVQALTCTNPLLLGSITQASAQFSFDTVGLYAQGTYKLTDTLSITGGIRYTIDTVNVKSRYTSYSLATNTAACFNRSVFAGAVTDLNQCLENFREHSEKPTWVIDLEYKPIDDVMLYAKYSRGYRQGGVNPTALGREQFQPEKVDAYEIGAKASFNTGPAHGYFNIAGFYNDFSNQQLVTIGIADGITIPGFRGAQLVLNAGKSRIQGVEVDAMATLFDAFRIEAGYTFLDTKLLQYTPPVAGAPYLAFQPLVVGGPLTNAPRHKLTLTGTYTLPLPEDMGKLSVGATYLYTAEQVQNASPLPAEAILPASNLVNLNVNWSNFLDKPVDLSFFVTNLTNKVFPIATGGTYSQLGYSTIMYSAPRMFGARVKVRFGN